ncbi:unnamed protein product [Camellia sinensis]
MLQIRINRVKPSLGVKFSKCRFSFLQKATEFSVFTEKVATISLINCYHSQSEQTPTDSKAVDKKITRKAGKKQHHLWNKRDSAGSGQKALNLVRIVSGLPNEKEAVYGALDKWTAWETEFPLIAAAKALRILRKRSQWIRVIQLRVSKWMLSKGQGATMGTYDTLLLAFDVDQRVDEAESLWNMILHTHTRSISKLLFARMISLYDHHNIPDKIIEVFADMEELGVKPDEDTVRKVARAFQKLGQADKKKLVLKKYLSKWKYIHYNGERVRFFHLDASRVESNIKFGKQEVMMVTTDVVKVMVVIPLSKKRERWPGDVLYYFLRQLKLKHGCNAPSEPSKPVPIFPNRAHSITLCFNRDSEALLLTHMAKEQDRRRDLDGESKWWLDTGKVHTLPITNICDSSLDSDCAIEFGYGKGWVVEVVGCGCGRQFWTLKRWVKIWKSTATEEEEVVSVRGVVD